MFNRTLNRVTANAIRLAFRQSRGNINFGNRSALEWILDQYKEKKPQDATIAERFNTYRFEDYKESVIDLFRRVTTVSVKTMEIINQMPKE